jgi:DNA-binding transcriptional ArsR family regulator
MNELDGNLTLWSENFQIKLNWNKVRGPEFEPRYYRIEKLSSPDILDIKGRQILLPICRAVSEQAAEQRERDEVDIKREILIAMDSQPGGSQRDWAATVGRTKSIVNRHLQALKAEGLVESIFGGKWHVTQKGKKAL